MRLVFFCRFEPKIYSYYLPGKELLQYVLQLELLPGIEETGWEIRFNHCVTPIKNDLAPTPMQGAFARSWILPRTKKHTPGMFFTPPSVGPSSSNPHPMIKKHQPQKWLVFFGRGWGIRTPANGVRVRCATVTQILYVRGQHGYYTAFFKNVKHFF